MLQFIWYLYKYTSQRYGGANKCVTAVGNYWKLKGYDWERKKHPTIRMMMTGYRDLKPSQKRDRYPFSFFHMKEALAFLILSTYTGLLIAAVLCIGYFFGGRSCEYSANSRKDWSTIIRRCDVEIIYNDPNKCPSSVIIDFRRHKSNRWGLYNAKVEAICACDTGVCPTRIISQFIKIRDRKWGSANNLPLLLIENKPWPIKSSAVNNAIKNLIVKMNLDPKVYASHSLRSGRATDLARANTSALGIKKWGRWRSNCWMDFYAKLDYSDIAKISHLTLHQLGIASNSICNNNNNSNDFWGRSRN